MLYFLDLLGTAAFAIYGAHLAQKKGYDLFGILVCSALSAIGGGTMRDFILNQIPAYFFDYRYFLVIILAAAFSIYSYKSFEKIKNSLLIVDAVGLVTFAFLGAATAYHNSLSLVGVIILATITAIGGGILRDICIGELPLVFYQDLYATPAIILGFLYFVLGKNMESAFFTYGLLISVFIFRLLAIKYKLNLWRPKQ